MTEQFVPSAPGEARPIKGEHPWAMLAARHRSTILAPSTATDSGD